MKDKKQFYGLMKLEMDNNKTAVPSIGQLTVAQSNK